MNSANRKNDMDLQLQVVENVPASGNGRSQVLCLVKPCTVSGFVTKEYGPSNEHQLSVACSDRPLAGIGRELRPCSAPSLKNSNLGECYGADPAVCAPSRRLEIPTPNLFRAHIRSSSVSDPRDRTSGVRPRIDDLLASGQFDRKISHLSKVRQFPAQKASRNRRYVQVAEGGLDLGFAVWVVRQAKKITQDALAERMQTSRTHISKLEVYLRPPLKTWLRAAAALEVPFFVLCAIAEARKFTGAAKSSPTLAPVPASDPLGRGGRFQEAA